MTVEEGAVNRLEKIRGRLDARTPGEWLPSRGYEGWDIEANSGPVTLDSGLKAADAIFITHAPADLAALLAVAEAAADGRSFWRCTQLRLAEAGYRCGKCPPCRLAAALAPLTEEEG